ncbi:MAG: MGMT family protein [Planctomycetota bacterium]|jgi:alkylated DNA nucleotide flippase Atl1
MTTAKWKLPRGCTWRQKLEQEHPNHGKVVRVPTDKQKRFGGATLLIPRPLDVDAVMRKVPKGKLITHGQIRALLADESKAENSCAMTTGMFILIAAEAAEEARRAGRKRITPYWRTIKDDGRLNAKSPEGAAAQARKLREEGSKIEPARGKQPPRVKDFERYLVKP